jgi:hypothetical protein
MPTWNKLHDKWKRDSGFYINIDNQLVLQAKKLGICLGE